MNTEANLAKLNRYCAPLKAYEGRADLSEDELLEVLAIAKNANELIENLQAQITMLALMERVTTKEKS